jgi:hypothetical protein
MYLHSLDFAVKSSIMNSLSRQSVQKETHKGLLVNKFVKEREYLQAFGFITAITISMI